MSDLLVEGEPDRRPFKVFQLGIDGEPVPQTKQDFATEEEALSRIASRLDRKYALYKGSQRLR